MRGRKIDSGVRPHESVRIKAMPRKQISFDTVREMGLALPGVEEGTVYGSPALKVHGKMFACIAIHKSAEPETLALRIAFDHRDELLAADPVGR